MKLLCKSLFVIFIIAVFDYGWAATYYVNYVGGSATTAGTSTATAWKYAPGDSRFVAACTGNCNTTWTGVGSRLNPGDKVIFKGGVTYTGSLITISWAGNADTTAGRIIFDGDSGIYAPRWGSGTDKAIIDGATVNGGFRVNNSGSYVTINSFEVKNGQLTRAESPFLIQGHSGASYLTISNNTVHDVGNFALTGGTCTGAGIASDGSDNLKIQNNTVYNCGYGGIGFTAATTHGSNLEISGNNVTDKVAWGISIAMASQSNLTNWNIFNNTIHDLVYYGRNSDPHVNYIWIYGYSDQSVTGINIYNNRIYTDGPSQPSSGGIHLEASTGGFKNVKIYNNVLKNIEYSSALYFTTRSSPSWSGVFNGLYIYNNSIHQASTGLGGIGLYGSNTGSYSNVSIQNNIFSIRGDTGSLAIALGASPVTGLTIDYNVYYLGSALPFDCGSGVTSWANFKTCTGNTEMHSKGTTADPLYTDVGATSHDLRISSISSPAYNAGAGLSTSIGSLDIMGNPRPQGAAWTIGAYEYSAYNTIQSPRQLRIVAR